MKPNIFIDLDDTVADFRFSAEALLGRKLPANCRGITDEEWAVINIRPYFFYHTLKLSCGAIDLVMYAKSIDSHIVQFLSAIPSKVDLVKVADAKQEWIEFHFPNTDYHFVKSTKDKVLYANGNILIDDKQDVIDAWNANGGYGILCNSCLEAKKELQSYIKSLTS